MASVVMCNMHGKVFESFCNIFRTMGVKVYCPKHGEPNYFTYNGNQGAPRLYSAYAIEKTREELDGLDIDVVLCCCWEQLGASKKLAKELGAALVLRAGNNNVPYTPAHSDFLLSNDIETYTSSKIRNKEFFYLPPAYDMYEPMDDYQQASRIVTSFVHFYERYWSESFGLYDGLRKKFKGFAFVNFGDHDGNGEYTPLLARRMDVNNMMSVSRAMLHIKEKEGYGWSILEAISMGLPVIAHRQYVEGKTCEHFLKGHVSCLYIDGNDLSGGFERAINNIDALIHINKEGPKFIRGLITMEEACEKVGRILERAMK